MAFTPKIWPGLRLACVLAGTRLVVGAVDAPPNPLYTGSWPIQEWTPEDIGGATQCFSIAQARDTGLIYVGTGQGVVEYDGVRWRQLPLLHEGSGQAARGLTVDAQGRIWTGLADEVVRYTPDAGGQWRAESMLGSLPETDRPTGVVWQLESVGDAVWGLMGGNVVRFGPDGKVHRWAMSNGGFLIGVTDDTVWFRTREDGLYWGRGAEFGPAQVPAWPPGTAGLSVYRTAASALRVDHTHGVLELRGEAWQPIAPDLKRLLESEQGASRARRLADGRGVFSTRSRALVLVAPDGQVLGRLAEPPGITFGVTPQTLVDRDGGLWMANAGGIRRVQADGIVAVHDRVQGLRGDIRDLVQEGPTLLAATAQGVFRRVAATGQFERVTANFTDVFGLTRGPVDTWLVAAGASFHEWNGSEALHLSGAPRSATALALDPADPARVFAGWVNRVMVYRRGSDAWTTEATVEVPGVTVYSLAMDERGVLWLGSGVQSGLWRLAAPGGDWTKARGERQSMPGNEVVWRVRRLEERLVAYGVKGIFRVDTQSGRLVPDMNFAGLPEGVSTSVATLASGGESGVLYVAGAGRFEGRYWRGTRTGRDESWNFAELPLAAAARDPAARDMVEAEDGRTLWLGGAKAALSLDLTSAAPPAFPVPAARWRRVRALEGGNVSYAGAEAREALTLPRGERAVAVEFAAPVYRVHVGAKTGVEYRTRATGVDHDWTAWSSTAARELTNLPAGTVRLEVQARNHLRAEGPVAALVLTVPPFWWETWWLRTLGVLAGSGIVALVVRAMVRRQFKQRIALLEAQAAVQHERLRIARDMHDDLGSTLASIVHLSAGTGESGMRPGATLARIHEATRDLVHRTRDIVWAATPEHDSLESLVEQLAAHAERALGDRGVEVKAELPAQVPEESVSAGGRHGLFLAFKEAVNNAAKYAQARAVIVRVELPMTEIVVTLADDGVGFAPGEKKGTGNGLGNMRARLAALGGGAEITSVVGRGTTVTLRLPRDKGGRGHGA